jgi:BlaI family transcriptional regulator, penicillinase repressor
VPHPQPSRPTDGELLILRVLWQRGGQTVGQIREQLVKDQNVSHQSVQSRLDIMEKKGYVLCNSRQRPYLYHAHISEDSTRSRLLKDMIRRVFGGSAKSLVMHTLAEGRTTPEELAEIRKHLDELERGK